MIHVDALFKRHGELEILKGISLTVNRGEVAAIIGPSGGGKSTFLRCINGLETFQGGAVRVGPHVLSANLHPRKDAAQLQKVRKVVGFVFQQFNLFPHLSVLGNLIEAPMLVDNEPKESAVARAVALLDRVGLLAKAEAYPRDLSGGQQQRVAIARTLMMRPEAILFDEPTSALDPVMANEVLGVISDLAKADQTMIVVTHSMRFARQVSDHVHVFAGGHDVEFGPPDKVFGDPQHETTKSFLKEAGKD
ncbi:MAG: amino acid ABC transporter ATP-binding protein [Deltaproteobacteria bacterium]|nr:amino acid ABC transporter ATP-binding protein [Deltaproteobacteria bacterium]MBK9368306.1 amino acid ABC transporter ATP-binding protein [Deltaproteobacteria bacterium]MBK9646918.1 amino acid ABC transporter ATP-binding protein [Deltaproteobacteria bacterium]